MPSLLHTALIGLGVIFLAGAGVVASIFADAYRDHKRHLMWQALRKEGRLQEWTNLP